MTALQDLLEETKECHHSLLKQLFANCPVEVLQQMQLIRLRKNQNLISTYQTSNPVFVLLDGRLQAIEERVVDIPYSFTELHPVDIVGDYELFTGMEGHYVTLKTMEASCCARLSAASYLHWMKSDANALFLRTQMLMKELSVQTQLQRQYLFIAHACFCFCCVPMDRVVEGFLRPGNGLQLPSAVVCVPATALFSPCHRKALWTASTASCKSANSSAVR